MRTPGVSTRFLCICRSCSGSVGVHRCAASQEASLGPSARKRVYLSFFCQQQSAVSAGRLGVNCQHKNLQAGAIVSD